jgi:hypothetical protein
MLVGDPSLFAIESEITLAYARPSFRALGFFVLHISGHEFGGRAPNASLLACSFDEVGLRLADRGRHLAEFSSAGALSIAQSLLEAFYCAMTPAITAVGLPSTEFADAMNAGKLLWAPDGDEAFDDSSYVIQFDLQDAVRLVGFRCVGNELPDASTVADAYLSADTFYGILEEWQTGFESEWRQLPKGPE